MIEKIRDLIRTLNEEIKYHDSVLEHSKNLEATLWGLEEQARMPENSSKMDQTELNEQMNRCRGKMINCRKLIQAHTKKMSDMISKVSSDCSQNCQK